MTTQCQWAKTIADNTLGGGGSDCNCVAVPRLWLDSMSHDSM